MTRLVVPKVVREELAAVWETMRSFMDDEWDEAVIRATARRRAVQFGPSDHLAGGSVSDDAIQQLAKWSFEGSQPWRQAFTSLLFSFALFDACRAQWQAYPENGCTQSIRRD